MDALHLALTAGRPWDLVLDVAAGKGAARRWPVLLHHVRRGGRLAVRLPGEPGAGHGVRRAGPRGPGSGRGAADARPRPARQPRPGPGRAGRLGRATCGSTTVGCVATNSVGTLAKVPEEDADAFLRARPEAGRMLTTVPPPALRVPLRAAVERAGPAALRDRRPGGVGARVRRRDLPRPPGGVRRRVRAAGELPAPVQAAAAQRGVRRVGAALRPRAPAGDRAPGGRRRTCWTAMSAATSGMPSPTRSVTSGAGGWPSNGIRTSGRWCSPSRAPSLATWELDLLAAGGVDADRVVVAHEPTRGRHAGRVVAAVRDAGLRAPDDRDDVRRGRHPPGRSGRG